MKKDKLFWDNLANIYNFMFANSKAYKKMYSLMKENLTTDMKILEVGCASGLVSRAISKNVHKIYAIDYSKDMISKAKEITKESNINFSIQDCNNLEFENKFFDVVIISNVLHILEKPENCLKEIKRVLKDEGLLIAPTFLWKEVTTFGKIQKIFGRLKKFPIHSEWDTKEYLDFLNNNGFYCIRKENIKNSFNICYVECKLKNLNKGEFNGK